MTLKVVLEPSDEGGYTVYVPSLPGCITQGETVEECVSNPGSTVEPPTEEAGKTRKVPSDLGE